MLGDVGFDPLGFSTPPVGPWFLGSAVPSQGVIGDLDWYREAELIHGRIAMVAAVGFLGPELFGTLPGNEWTGLDAYSNTNPLEAWQQVRELGVVGGEEGGPVTELYNSQSSLCTRRLAAPHWCLY